MTASFFKPFLRLDFRPLFSSYRINTFSKSRIPLLSSQASLPRLAQSKSALYTVNALERAYEPLTHAQSLTLFFQAFVHWFASPYTIFCSVTSNKFLILLLLLDIFIVVLAVHISYTIFCLFPFSARLYKTHEHRDFSLPHCPACSPPPPQKNSSCHTVSWVTK